MASLAAMLAAFGCSTTLEEYRCEVADDCAGEMIGRCEPGGHCSFVDRDCNSGFRFGQNSGSESNSCVGEDLPPDLEIDAGPSETPIARISAFSVDCDQTSATMSGIESEAFGPRSLTSFSWRLLGPEGQLLDEFAGAPSESVPVGIHRLDGTFQSPVVNATTYEGRNGLRADFPVPGASVSTWQYTIGVEFIDAAKLQQVLLTFAVATSIEGAAGAVSVIDADDQILLSANFVTGGAMEPYRISVDSIPDVNIDPPVTMHFGFDKAGTYRLDNVSLVEVSTGLQGVSNGSFESTASPWLFGNTVDGLNPALISKIPKGLLRPGIYTIELQVTDSGGNVSAPDEVQFGITECSTGMP